MIIDVSNTNELVFRIPDWYDLFILSKNPKIALEQFLSKIYKLKNYILMDNKNEYLI